MTTLTLKKLKTEGRLGKGDTVHTPRLGDCTVAWIESTHTIVVERIADQKLYVLSGLSLGKCEFVSAPVG